MTIHDISQADARATADGLRAALERTRQRLEQLGSLHDLSTDTIFRDYQSELGREIESLKEQLCRPDCALTDFTRGQIAGLRRAINFFQIRAEEAQSCRDEAAEYQAELDLLENRGTRYGENESAPTPN